LLVSHSSLALVLVHHPMWNPRGNHVNGWVLEVSSIFGPFFHISVIPDPPVFDNREPNVGDALICIQLLRIRGRQLLVILINTTNWTTCLQVVRGQAQQLVLRQIGLKAQHHNFQALLQNWTFSLHF
jgi:hypothetical protein